MENITTTATEAERVEQEAIGLEMEAQQVNSTVNEVSLQELMSESRGVWSVV